MIETPTKRLFLLLAWMVVTVAVGYVEHLAFGLDFKDSALFGFSTTTLFPLLVFVAVYGLP
jgi:hypothetical protein